MLFLRLCRTRISHAPWPSLARPLSTSAFSREKLCAYAQLARIEKPIGTWLVLWPSYWGLGLAGCTDPLMYASFAVGATAMRGAGCTINDVLDRKYDAKVARTKQRPLANGSLSTKEAVGFLGAQLSVALGVLMTLNPFTHYVAASSLLFVGTYPLMKRFFRHPQLFLGLTFSWGVLVAWAAVKGSLDPFVVIPLCLSSMSWTYIFDTIYGHQDKEDDAKLGLYSTALTLGHQTKAFLLLFVVLYAAGTAAAGMAADANVLYYACTVFGGTSHILWQVHSVNLDDPASCHAAFASNKWTGGLIFLGCLISSI